MFCTSSLAKQKNFHKIFQLLTILMIFFNTFATNLISKPNGKAL